MTTTTKGLAEKIAAAWKGPADFEALREFVDIKTGGEMDAVKLDILTDMTVQRVRERRHNA